ncbi:dihydrofolate reductase family protein [Streptomyces phaeochromogenes]
MTSTSRHSTTRTAAPVLVRHAAGSGTLGGVGLALAGTISVQFADPNDYLGGEDGERLHHWSAPDGQSGQLSAPARQFADEIIATGAVLAGRRTAELMDHWGGDHHGVPIFVPSHRPPGPAARWGYPLVTYVADGIESAMAQAKAAAGDRNVLVHGAYTAQRALAAGVLDEVQIHQIPVLLGGGHRLFDVLPSQIELEVVQVIDTPEATHIRYRVRR